MLRVYRKSKEEAAAKALPKKKPLELQKTARAEESTESSSETVTETVLTIDDIFKNSVRKVSFNLKPKMKGVTQAPILTSKGGKTMKKKWAS